MKQDRGTGGRQRGSLSRQGLLVNEDPIGPPDGPSARTCGTPPDDALSHEELHLPLSVALERNDPRAQGGGQKHAQKPASGETPIAGMKDMGGVVIRLPKGADECVQQAPREAAHNVEHPVAALHGHGTADDVLLPQFPRIPVGVCIPLCPDTTRPRGDDTMDYALNLTRSSKDDHVPLPHIFGTARDEKNPVPRLKQGTHAVAPAEEFPVKPFFESPGRILL